MLEKCVRIGMIFALCLASVFGAKEPKHIEVYIDGSLAQMITTNRENGIKNRQKRIALINEQIKHITAKKQKKDELVYDDAGDVVIKTEYLDETYKNQSYVRYLNTYDDNHKLIYQQVYFVLNPGTNYEIYDTHTIKYQYDSGCIVRKITKYADHEQEVKYVY